MGVEITPALNVPGVVAVLTGADATADGLSSISHNPLHSSPPDIPIPNRDGSDHFVAPHYVLPDDKARFVGEPIAMVIADTIEIARDGAELVEVVYEPLTAVADVKSSLELEAVPVWEMRTDNLCIDGNVGEPDAVAAMIDDYLGPRLEGEPCLATEKCYDMMVRMGAPHGATGMHAYAVSAIDLALWDLKGKLLQRPVYELIGGPARDELFCYSTGGDTDWYMELVFKATKLPCPYGPADGLDGLRKNVEMVASSREQVGDDVELMLDCWMSSDVETAVRRAETMTPVPGMARTGPS